VVGGGIRPGITRAEHDGQRLAAAVWAVVGEHRQRVKAFSELNDHGVLAMSLKAGMPRLMAVLRRAVSLSSWVSLAFAAARLIASPSASPVQPCCRASLILAIRLSRMLSRRGR
jgi:hypothetical protein